MKAGQMQVGIAKSVLAFAGLAVLACNALVFGAARMVRTDPGSWVAGFAYDDGSLRVANAIRKNDAKGAVVALRDALVDDPVDRHIIGLLGMQQQLAGDVEGAFTTFSVGKALGWRDAPTLLYWYDSAIQNEDWPLATEQLDGLLRSQPALAENSQLLDPVLANDVARGLLAKRLNARPNWGDSFLTAGPNKAPEELQARADVVRLAAANAWSCESISRFVATLLASGLPAEAKQSWAKSCPAFASLIYDGDLAHALASDRIEQATRLRGFNWQLMTIGSVEASRITTDGTDHQRLRVQVSGAVSAPVMRQITVLAPGSYRLGLSAANNGGAGNIPAISVSLSCGMSRVDAMPTTPVTGKPGRMTVDLSVPPDCEVQYLAIWLEPGADVLLSDLELRAL